MILESAYKKFRITNSKLPVCQIGRQISSNNQNPNDQNKKDFLIERRFAGKNLRELLIG